MTLYEPKEETRLMLSLLVHRPFGDFPTRSARRLFILVSATVVVTAAVAAALVIVYTYNTVEAWLG